MIEVSSGEKVFWVRGWEASKPNIVLERIKLQLDLARQVWPEEFKGVSLRVAKRALDDKSI